ncbi:MAG: hypothetical protein QXZ09_06435 [Candidatus Methanomethylicaceae archaeon]
MDTCVYCGYAYRWDGDNEHCGRLFESDRYSRNTSLTVKLEIEEICRDLGRFLRDVAKKGLRQVIDQEQSKKRKDLFEKIAGSLIGKDPADQYAQLRTATRIIVQAFSEAMERTCKPILAQSKDYLLIQSLYLIGNESDAQILGDAIEWAKSLQGTALFFTKDRCHVLENHKTICKVIRNHYGSEPNIDFKHVSQS